LHARVWTILGTISFCCFSLWAQNTRVQTPACPQILGTWEGIFKGQPTEQKPDGSYPETVKQFRLALKASGRTVTGSLTVLGSTRFTVPVKTVECWPEGCSLEVIDNSDGVVFTWFIEPHATSLMGNRNSGSRTKLGIGTGARLFEISAKRIK
jgi:hypothetical protein